MTIIGIDPSFRACGISDGARHWVVKTLPEDSDPTQAEMITRRCREIIAELVILIHDDFDGDKIALYVEGPAFNATPATGSHLYELGWLMREIHRLTEDGIVEKVVEVPPATLRKWATGKGNTPKDAMKLAVYKRFGVEFTDDSGCDKLFAYLLCKFGEAVEAGSVEFTASAKRGEKRRKAVRA